MANIRTSARSFNGGEVTPEFFGRIDDAKYQTGLALCQNFIVLPHGPIANRGGTAFVRRVKHSATATRLLKFNWSADQTMVLEFGDGYFRFHTDGGTVLNGASEYEVVHPYTADQLFDVQYVQSADVMTLVHPAHPPRELRRYGALDWRLVDIVFGTRSPTPGAPNVTASGSPTNPRDYIYGITTVVGSEESLLGPTDTVSNNLDEGGTANVMTWTAVPNVDYYRVYRFEGGVMAFVGVASTPAFRDEGIVADVTLTPPNAKNPFTGTGKFPSTVTYFEQRRAFAATIEEPQMLWMTKPGTESNLNTSLPVRDDDAVNFRLAARERNTIRHLVPLQDLIVPTQAAGWRIGEDVTPTSIKAKPQAWSGASKVPPLTTNASLVFGAARGGHVRELGYSQDAGGYITNDLSLRATHLFDGFTLVDSAQSEAPYAICWFVSSNGALLGVTYLPEQNIAAWHRHTTQGVFESAVVVAEGEEDALYVVVRRQINGETVRYVERMHTRAVRDEDADDAFFVDAGVRYSGPPVSSISQGLSHLEGQTVAILADGEVLPQRVVSGGGVPLDGPASEVVVGLPIEARGKTLPFAAEMQGYGQGRPKNVLKVWARVNLTRGFWSGPAFDDMMEVKTRVGSNMGDPPPLFSGELEMVSPAKWEVDGALCFEQRDPLPCTLLSLVLEVGVGG